MSFALLHDRVLVRRVAVEGGPPALFDPTGARLGAGEPISTPARPGERVSWGKGSCSEITMD